MQSTLLRSRLSAWPLCFWAEGPGYHGAQLAQFRLDMGGSALEAWSWGCTDPQVWTDDISNKLQAVGIRQPDQNETYSFPLKLLRCSGQDPTPWGLRFLSTCHSGRLILVCTKNLLAILGI